MKKHRFLAAKAALAVAIAGSIITAPVQAGIPVIDALFKGLEQQQRNLAADARQLEQLQGRARGQ